MRPRLLDAPRRLDDSGCGCSREKIAAKPKATAASYNVQVVDGVPGKAQIWPGTGRIQVDRAFWSSIPQASKDAVMAHEMAHDEDPNACEACADARAGARLRWAGYDATVAVNALGDVVKSRSAGRSVLEGWQAADEAIRAKSTTTIPLREAPQIAPDVNKRRGFVMPGVRSIASVGSVVVEDETAGQSVISAVEDDAAGQSFGDVAATTTPQPSSSDGFLFNIAAGLLVAFILTR